LDAGVAKRNEGIGGLRIKSRVRLLAAIDQLSDVHRTPYYKSHSPGVLDYLRAELGERLPSPEYGLADVDPWDEFVRWGQEILAFPGAMEDERPYKLQIAANAKALRDAIEAAPADWLPLLRRVFGPPNNLTYFLDHQRFIDWAETQPATAKVALESSGTRLTVLRGLSTPSPASYQARFSSRPAIRPALLPC